MLNEMLLAQFVLLGSGQAAGLFTAGKPRKGHQDGYTHVAAGTAGLPQNSSKGRILPLPKEAHIMGFEECILTPTACGRLPHGPRSAQEDEEGVQPERK